MPQTIIKAVSPSPEPEDEGEIPSSTPTMPLAGPTNESDPMAASEEEPAMSKIAFNTANKYTPPTYLPPSNTTELPDIAAAPAPTLLTETEDTKEAEEEHEPISPLLPLNSEVINKSTSRNTGAFILLWIVAIVLAPLAVAMCYAAYCIFREFSLGRWLAVLPDLPFIGVETVKQMGEAALEEMVSEVSEGHVEL